MRKTINTLKDLVPIIQRMGAEVGINITEEDIAKKMGIPLEQFDTYLKAPGETPNAVLTQLWVTHDDLLQAVVRSNNKARIAGTINALRRVGATKGLNITDEEIIEKMGIPRQEFEAYLSGAIVTPENIFTLFRSTWPELFKNIHIVRSKEIELDEGE